VRFSRGDIIEDDYRSLVPQMTKAVDGINRAATIAAQSAQLYEMARASQYETAFDLQGLATTPERFATLQHAIDVRFHNASIDYGAMLANDLSPGQVVAASIVAADTGTTPQSVIDAAVSGHQSIIEVANGRGMQTLSLAIFMNLILFDYVDDPDKEARVQA